MPPQVILLEIWIGALAVGPMQTAMTHLLLPISTLHGEQLSAHNILLPHRFLSALWNADAEAFVQYWAGGSEEALERFWLGLRGTRYFRKAQEVGLRKTIPIIRYLETVWQ